MPSSTAKRAVLYRFDRQPLEGYVNQNSYLLEQELEIISATGNLQSVSYNEVKALCFASEASGNKLFTDHNLFERRPKVPGLWTRFTFRDGDQLDGILPHNLLEWPKPGYFVTPPRAGATRQRVFIPRLALNQTELRGVVGTSLPVSPRSHRDSEPETTQLKMFDL